MALRPPRVALCIMAKSPEADSDTPTLPTGLLDRAVTLATSGGRDLVLGPSEDGGYYPIGLRGLHRELFSDMAWSTSAVLAETERQARAAGLSVARLPSWYDVDTGADLARLITDLEAGGGDGPRHTRRLLLEIRGERTAGAGGRV